MGKAAFNERLKLAATYWNNISAGLTLTGLIIPYLALNYWIVDLIAWVPDWLDGKAGCIHPSGDCGCVRCGNRMPFVCR